MTARELIEQYKISISPADDSKIRFAVNPKDKAAIEEIKAKKAEIIETIKADQKARDDERKRRAANVESIPGLAELKKAIAEWNEWHEALNASFDGPEAVGGMDVGPRPKHPDTIKEKYPQAAAYVEAQKVAHKENRELSAIGKKAVERFEDNPADWEAIIADMNKEISEFATEHAWD